MLTKQILISLVSHQRLENRVSGMGGGDIYIICVVVRQEPHSIVKQFSSN